MYHYSQMNMLFLPLPSDERACHKMVEDCAKTRLLYVFIDAFVLQKLQSRGFLNNIYGKVPFSSLIAL